MKKLFNTETIAISKSLPTKLNIETEVIQAIATAKNPEGLTNVLVQLAQAKELYTKTKKEFNEQLKEKQKDFKAVETIIKTIEESAKDKALKLFDEKTDTKLKQDINEYTGEVKQIVKTTRTNNLGKGVFTYTRAKTIQEVDYQAILDDKKKYKKFIKEKIVYEVDADAINKAMEEGTPLPFKIQNVDAKIGIQWKSILANADKLLEDK